MGLTKEALSLIDDQNMQSIWDATSLLGKRREQPEQEDRERELQKVRTLPALVRLNQ